VIKRAAFLDRDGVINKAIIESGIPEPPSNIKDLVILDGVIESIEILFENSFIPVVITNQPDVARGKKTINDVNLINEKISQLTKIKHFYSCFHDDLDKCKCRKPKPGMILQATSELDLDISESFLVGDRRKDIEAGQKMNIRSYFIDYKYNESRPQMPFTKVDSLLEAVLRECENK
jgi:D-glycero-D-manno-heptose 1,7-bisphosphate phosphatase